MKSMLALLLFVLSQSTVLAAPVTYDFAFTGFDYARDGIPRYWSPLSQFSGRFSGEDLDGNGAIDKSELTYFAFAGITPLDPCEGWHHCSLDEFRYAPGDIVRLRAWENYDYDYPIMLNYQSFDLERPFSTGDYFFEWSDYYYYTENTVFTITPVPEPSAALMLAAGLGLTGLALRRRSAVRA